jgi:serine/threonine-protein kinase
MRDPSTLEESGDGAELKLGSRVGKYEIVRRLGQGGMGAVYEGLHVDIGKRVAIKTLNASISAMPGARARFLREAQLSSKIRHPHIVDVTDMGDEGGHAYIVMEILEGEDLAQRARRGRILAHEVVDIMLPVCSAVSAAHRQGITHRDLKPENIFLARGPHGIHPKVLDFGISKATENEATGSLTGTGAIIGTPFYLAPEQIVDARAAGPSSDQYALGVILYECLTGCRPYEADTLFVTFQAIVAGGAKAPRSIRADIPAPLEHVVMRAMSTEPKARFSSTEALAQALLPFASARARSLWQDAFGLPAAAETQLRVAVEASTPSASLDRWPSGLVEGAALEVSSSKRRLVTIALGVGAVVGLTVGLALFKSRRTTPAVAPGLAVTEPAPPRAAPVPAAAQPAPLPVHPSPAAEPAKPAPPPAAAAAPEPGAAPGRPTPAAPAESAAAKRAASASDGVTPRTRRIRESPPAKAGNSTNAKPGKSPPPRSLNPNAAPVID